LQRIFVEALKFVKKNSQTQSAIEETNEAYLMDDREARLLKPTHTFPPFECVSHSDYGFCIFLRSTTRHGKVVVPYELMCRMHGKN
jgi:hypothetical protein